MTSTVRALNCPVCGGALVVGVGGRRATCGSCRSPCAILSREAGRRVRILPSIDAAEAAEVVRRALQTWPVDAQAMSAALFRRPDLLYVPYCEFRAVTAGVVVRRGTPRSARGGKLDVSTGTRRFVNDAGAEVTEAEYYRYREITPMDAKVLLGDWSVTVATAGPAEWSLDAVDVAGMLADPSVRTESFDAAVVASQGAALVARGGIDRAEAALRAYFSSKSGTRVDLIAPRVRWIFLPLWIVRCAVGRHSYTFVVDAVRGQILSGHAPESRRRRGAFGFAAAVGVGLPLGFAASAVAGGWGHDPVGLDPILEVIARLWLPLGIAAFVLVSLVALAWGEFRYRGEVVFTRAGPIVRKHSRPDETAIERFAAWISEQISWSVGE